MLKKLYLANTGAFDCGEIIEFESYEDLANKSKEKQIDLVIIGPENPLCYGIVDIFNKFDIKCIGVNKKISELESSKIFGKNFMHKYGIKTADYVITDDNSKVSALPLDKFPLVIKADGLCKGKGVKIAYDRNTAMTTIVQYLMGKFGESSKKMLLEEFLDGPELSLTSLWDGSELLSFLPSRDFKKLDNTKDAQNTGGMGAFCPVSLTEEQQTKLEDYKKQLKNALQGEKADFAGFIYSGLIWTKKNGVFDWYVLEYNVRLGDPDAQAILTHLDTDFLEILYNASINNLGCWLQENEIKYKKWTSGCLVVASEGYPNFPKTGALISILNDNNVKIYYAGVKKENNLLYSSGGRVLSLCTTSENPFPRLKAYAETISMQNKYFRKDIDINTNSQSKYY